MPTLKNKLSNLTVALIEVAGEEATQEKSLETLFQEQGFMALTAVKVANHYPCGGCHGSCSCGSLSCTTSHSCTQCREG